MTVGVFVFRSSDRIGNGAIEKLELERGIIFISVRPNPSSQDPEDHLNTGSCLVAPTINEQPRTKTAEMHVRFFSVLHSLHFINNTLLSFEATRGDFGPGLRLV